MMTDGRNENGQVLQLPAVLDLNAATPLHERFLSMRGGDLTVDASLVERIGGQCLQVLLSAQRTWEREKLRFTVSAASEGFVKTLGQMGMGPEMLPAKETVG